jgi:cytochrome c oxidase subunit 1
MFIGMNLTFAPMHMLGLNGMPRRTYRYGEGLGFDLWNLVATVGSFVLAIGVLLFLINAWRSRKGELAGPDPWDGRTLEWATSSPPPVHNFDQIPVVQAEDDFWHRKYGVDEQGRSVARDDYTPYEPSEPPADMHMPSPSYYPILSAFGMFGVIMGLVYVPWGLVASGLGAVVMLWGLFGWSMEDLVREHH